VALIVAAVTGVAGGEAWREVWPLAAFAEPRADEPFSSNGFFVVVTGQGAFVISTSVHRPMF
jgi:hypothetical protein